MSILTRTPDESVNRKTLISLIYSQEGNVTAYELLHLFREINPQAESMTVYRALDFLQKHHLILHRCNAVKLHPYPSSA